MIVAGIKVAGKNFNRFNKNKVAKLLDVNLCCCPNDVDEIEMGFRICPNPFPKDTKSNGIFLFRWDSIRKRLRLILTAFSVVHKSTKSLDIDTIIGLEGKMGLKFLARLIQQQRGSLCHQRWNLSIWSLGLIKKRFFVGIKDRVWDWATENGYFIWPNNLIVWLISNLRKMVGIGPAINWLIGR